MSRRLRPRPRRGAFQQVPYGQRTVHLGNIRRRGRTLAIARRGQFFQVPPLAAASAAPALVAQLVQQAGSRSHRLSARSGQFFSAPRNQRTPHPGDIRRRGRMSSARRGAFLTVPPATVVVVTPVLPPQAFLRRRIAIPPVRRGLFIPPPQPTTVVPQFVSSFIQQVGSRSRGVSARRGFFSLVPKTQRALHPGNIRQRVKLASVRRGQYWALGGSLIVTAVPSEIKQPRKRLPRSRRGAFLSAPYSPIIPPPARLPSSITQRRRYLGVRTRRGRWMQGATPILIQYAVPIAITGSTTPLAVTSTATTTVFAITAMGTTRSLAMAH